MENDQKPPLSKWNFKAEDGNGGTMQGTFYCKYDTVAEAAANFENRYKGWKLKSISLSAGRRKN